MVSLVLDVNGLSTCMAHPLTEDAHLREGEAGVFLFRDLLYPLPLRRNRMESSAQGLLAPIPTITARSVWSSSQSIRVSAKAGACGFVGTSLFCFGRFGARRWSRSWLVLLAVITGSNSRSATIDVQPVVLELHPVHASVGTDAERHHQVADEA